jgi:threonine/homoserine/homoserine lactone efflux protein
VLTTATLGSFLLLVGLLTLTPGLDTALVLRTAAVGERARAWGVITGIQLGTLAWGALTAVGVTALLTASHVAYTALRWVGAAYLVWMGVQLLRSSLRRAAPAEPDEALVRGGGFVGGLRRGLLTNLLNPKVGAFYVALLPQFLPAGGPVLLWGLLLAGMHVLLATTWSAVIVLFVSRSRRLLQRPAVRRWIDRVTGGVLTAFGVRLALGD